MVKLGGIQDMFDAWWHPIQFISIG